MHFNIENSMRSVEDPLNLDYTPGKSKDKEKKDIP